jgi:hypothetical protein
MVTMLLYCTLVNQTLLLTMLQQRLTQHLCPVLLLLWRRKRQTDMDAVRRFLREDLWQAMDKVLVTGNNSRFWIEEEYAADALHLFVKLAASVLKYRQQQSPAVLQELDADIGSLVLLLMHAFNPGKPVHQRFKYTSFPQQVYEKHRDDCEAMENAPWPWVLQQPTNPAGEDLLDDDLLQDDEEHAWLTHIANVFGALDGFSILVQVRGSASGY